MALPVLTSTRLTLRQLSLNDQQDIFALRADPEVNKYLGRPLSKTHADAIQFINKINESIEKQAAYYWAVVHTATGKLAGTICLFDLSDEAGSCEIGYELLPKYQQQGIMLEAATTVISFIFDTLHFKTITATSHVDNLQSARLLKKLGFVQVVQNDQGSHLLVFTLTKQ